MIHQDLSIYVRKMDGRQSMFFTKRQHFVNQPNKIQSYQSSTTVAAMEERLF